MNIKQVIIIVRSPENSHRYVYGSDGEFISGDEVPAYENIDPGATLTIAVRGRKGETLSATISLSGECLSGSIESVAAAMEGFPNEQLANIFALRDEGDSYEPPAIISSVQAPTPLSSVGTSEDGATEGTGAIPEGDSDRDSGDNGE